jgi:hypothetical protein
MNTQHQEVITLTKNLVTKFILQNHSGDLSRSHICTEYSCKKGHHLTDYRLQAMNTHLFPLASLAAILRVDPLPLTTAFCTHWLDLLDHTWTQLLDLNLHSSTPACGTLVNCTLLAPSTCSINVSSQNCSYLGPPPPYSSIFCRLVLQNSLDYSTMFHL